MGFVKIENNLDVYERTENKIIETSVSTPKNLFVVEKNNCFVSQIGQAINVYVGQVVDWKQA